MPCKSLRPGQRGPAEEPAPVLKRALRRMLIAWLVWALGRTTRVIRINWNVLEHYERERQPYLMGLWHNNILTAMPILSYGNFPVMISRSRDGDDIAWVADRFRYIGVRGSPRAGASGALRHAMRLLHGQRPVIVTPDGPRGPRYELKAGIVALARKMRVPIVPVAFSPSPRWELRSWDRMKLPRPFGRVAVLVGDPIWLDPSEDEEPQRVRMEAVMRDLMARADAFSGADAQFPDAALAGQPAE